MNDIFSAVKITDRIWWVGAIDWELRDFHGYATSRGTTYNAYLVLGDRPVLIDTVKKPFRDEMLGRIASVVDPKDISIIVSNHAEMDHTGCLPDIIDMVKPEKVYASVKGVEAIDHHFGLGGRLTAVRDGETIACESVPLTFIETRMLHWPDSMVSFLPDDGVLFSQDAFGMHLATCERFADQIDIDILREEASKYYANILLPYSGLIPRAVEKLAAKGVKPAIIAPDHGPVRRTDNDINAVMGWYGEWSSRKPGSNVLVVYDTMWQSTALMARAIAEGVQSGGAGVRIMPLKASNRSEAATALLGAGALVVGSPTINNGVFPTVADTMSYLTGLKPKNLVGAAFGSYGWSGESVGIIETMLDTMKIERVADSVRAMYVPDNDALVRCRELGAAVGKRVKERHEGKE